MIEAAAIAFAALGAIGVAAATIWAIRRELRALR